MPLEIRVPSVGESVTEAVLAEWFKKNGDPVEKDEPIFVIETDKVTLEVTAEGAGALRIQVAEGETVAIGDVVGAIDTDGAAAAPTPAPAPAPAAAEPAAAAAPAPPPEPAPVPVAQTPAPVDNDALPMAAPSVRRLVAETGVDIDQVLPTGPGGRVTKADVLRHLEQAPAAPTPAPSQETPATAVEATVRKPMSPIRKRIAAHLLAAKQNTAMLTTFNEIDMSGAMAMRSAHKEAFSAKYGVGLGFMSIFTKACAVALAEIPEINAQIDGDDIVYNAHAHIGVAIGSERGLVVPVIRQADTLGFAAIEQAIVDYVTKIKSNKLTMADMEGGTFTISNGGVYGSLLSTPILNAPQSAILGMHNIEKRPVVVNDEIVIRPMMYVALSYDHRIVDGKGAVTFLKRVKEFVEDPQRLLLEV